MTTRNRILSATVLLAVTSGLVYWIVKPKASNSVAGQAQTSADAPPNPAHELASLEESLRQSPNHVPILLRLAEMKHQAGKISEAITHLQSAVKAEPANVDARLELGRLLFESKDIDGALQVTNEILKSDPKNVDALYNIGAIYGNLGKEELAREYWGRAIAAAPDSESGRKAKAGMDQLRGQTVPQVSLPASLPAGHPPMK